VKVLQEIQKFKRGSVGVSLLPAGHAGACAGCKVRDCYVLTLYKHRQYIKQAHNKRLKILDVAATLDAARLELEQLILCGYEIPWLRINPLGASPTVKFLKDKKIHRRYYAAARKLLTVANDAGIPVHWPVQGKEKARQHRRQLGDLCVIRESMPPLHDIESFNGNSTVSRSTGARAVIVGKKGQGNKNNLAAAEQVAQCLRDNGNTVSVCSATREAFAVASERPRRKKRQSELCGSCTDCANPSVDVVIYPWHA